jgi:hypothetical protein|tara:strand:+ start:941 stop:1930 length:990 start_codon:yes stop_codon:yes gene_type:complete
MANILVRSPRFESITLITGYQSAVLTLKIDGVLRYTILKTGTAGDVITFEISELIRDYITQTFTGGQSQPITVATTGSVILQYASLNGTGTPSGSAVAIDHTAFNGYGTFMEGVNPTLANDSIWLLSKDVVKDGYYIYEPIGSSGWVSQISAGGTPTQVGFNSATTIITVGTTTLNIVRVDCTRYGDGNKITFLNKFGALQDLWFFLKKVKSTSSTKETYSANTISTSSGSATYSVNAATKTVFNKTANQRVVLSSGYYPEGANPYFEELLLSDQIWMTQPDPYNPATEQIVPVIINTSSFTYKTSLNDRLINYVMEFEMAFDYINNVR